jgi:serine/threonine-protein kinase HipA
LTINNKNADIERADLLQIARRYNIKGAETIINKAVDVVSNYAHYAQLAGISDEWTKKVLEETKYRINLLKV